MNFKNSQEAQTYLEIWNFHKKYYGINTDMETWRQILAEAKELDDKLNNDFARSLISAVVLHLNKQATEKLKGARMDGTRA